MAGRHGKGLSGAESFKPRAPTRVCRMPESVVDLLDEYAVRHGCTQADAFWMLYERRKAPAASDRDGGQTRRS